MEDKYMTEFKNKMVLAKAILSNIQIVRVQPSINWFLIKYMGKFNLINIDGQLIIHSHLPSVNSKAFTRFINEHLLARTEGPSHAQIGLTNACPQNCQFCYNKNRSGELLSTAEIKQIIKELKKMGVFWLGFTGGEPLLNKDIVEIFKSVEEKIMGLPEEDRFEWKDKVVLDFGCGIGRNTEYLFTKNCKYIYILL